MDERQRLAQQQEHYANEYALVSEKIRLLRERRIIETDPVVLFKLQHDLAEVMKQQDQLVQEMEALEGRRFSTSHPTSLFLVPYSRNPIFTGQERLLNRLAETLKPGAAVALAQPQAITGLGGIGKTQLAVEYAYRHRQDYQIILWTRADTTEALITGYVAIAQALQLPHKEEQDQSLVVKAVQEWFKRECGWLLILDNADDLALVRPFLPPTYGGDVLLTTRAQTMGRFAQRIEVDIMDADVGAVLLLRRATLIADNASLDAALPSDRVLARAITQELGGLPLALDQAGAYIEETQCGLAEYQRQYQTRRADLLALRGGLVDDHPEPVATTWSLSFQRVEQANPMAADLLRICAFLAPDAIPEELLMEALKTPLPPSGTSKKQRGPGGWFSWLTSESHQKRKTTPLLKSEGEINKAVAILRAYSLIQRDTREKTVQVHRLVQAVVRDALEEQDQVVWMTRVVCSVNVLFPEVEFGTWKHCARYLPQALACDAWIAQSNLKLLEGASLLNRVGRYLQDRAQYAEAEPLYQRALRIYELALGPDHPSTGNTLHQLATLAQAQGKYAEAEPLYQRTLRIYELALGPDHPATGNTLHQLAVLAQDQGKYAEAEPLYQRALRIYELALGPDHPATGNTLHELARLAQAQGKYAEAEPLYQRALRISELALGPDHPATGTTLHQLATLAQAQGKYAEAEPLYQRALRISELALGPDHPSTGTTLHQLATLAQAQGKYAEAEPLYQHALRIYELALGPDHPATGNTLHQLAVLAQAQGKYAEAEPLYQRALRIYELALGPDHPSTGTTLHALAVLAQAQGKYAEAEPLYQRALRIYELALGPDHPSTGNTRRNYASLLAAMKQDDAPSV